MKDTEWRRQGIRSWKGKKKMKKLLTLILAIVLVCGGMISVSQANEQGWYEYILKKDGTIEISQVREDCTDQVIPSELDGKTVTSIGNGAFYGCQKLKTVVIPEGVTSIGKDAFNYCYNLTSITLPGSVESIGEGLLAGSYRFKEIHFPKEHPTFAFSNSALIRKSDMTVIRVAETKAQEYELPWGVKKIACSAFEGNKVKSVIIPDSVTTIDASAFADCSNLTYVYIPGSVTKIGVQAFRGCTKLKSVRIPNSVTQISDGAFDWCHSLETIEVDPDHPVYAFGNGALIVKETREMVYCAGATKGTYEIPGGIERIGQMAFHGNKNLREVIVPDSVTTIGPYAFCDCKNLTKARLPEGLKVIGSNMFSYSDKLKEVYIPSTVTDIESYAFERCKSLKKIVLPEGVKNIGRYAFAECTGLTSIEIPSTVNIIESTSFDGCKNLACTVKEGSYAKEYCEKNNIKYIIAE